MKFFIEPRSWLRHDLLPEMLLSQPVHKIAERLKISVTEFKDEDALVQAFGVELEDGIFFTVVQSKAHEGTASVFVPVEYCKNNEVKQKILRALGEPNT